MVLYDSSYIWVIKVIKYMFKLLLDWRLVMIYIFSFVKDVEYYYNQ